MTWNWEQHDWPNFRYDASSLAMTTREFFRRAGELRGQRAEERVLVVEVNPRLPAQAS